uniref:Uncharacterized protein n=1 Tax=Graphocephala atropunctata TaxID=36148 RepID=A0A1B6KJV7_9HEMI
MGMDAGVQLYLYKGDVLVREAYVDCYKCSSNEASYPVDNIDFDRIMIRFTTEYDTPSETDSEYSEDKSQSDVPSLKKDKDWKKPRKSRNTTTATPVKLSTKCARP